MKLQFLLFSILFIYSVKSEESPYYLGADFGYGFVNYDANFSNFDGINKCGIYESGTGNNLKGRIFAEYKISNLFNIGFHIGYDTKNSVMDKLDTALARNLNTGKVEIVETNNQLDMNFNSIELGLDFNVLLIKDLFNGPLYLNISPNLFFQTNGNYIQKEFINNPDGAAFQIDDRIFFEKLNAEGKFTTLENNIFAISTGLCNSMKFAHNMYLTQRIGLAQDFGSFLTDAKINSLLIYASLGVKIAFDEPKAVIPTIPPLRPIQPQPIEPKPIPNIKLESNFDYIHSYIEKGEKLIATTPIVLAVFFDLNKSNIKTEYLSQNDRYEDPIKEHYNIFKNLKEIIDKYSDAKLKLWGSTSGEDENNSLELAKKRVESVKNELLKLGIPSSKLITTYSINPKIITNIEYKEGLEENRRVTIELINANSVEFVKKTDYERLFGKVDFNIVESNIESNVMFESSIIKKNEIIKPGRFSKSFENNILGNNKLEIISKAKIDEIIRDEDSMKVDFNNVKVKKVNLKTDEFEAVLMFDFSSAKLTNEAQILLKQLIELLPDRSTIQMIGNSDNIGLEQYNKQIASDRADAAIQFIKGNSNKSFYFEKLTNIRKFDESTPQGRYLNRSIKIRIK